MKRLGFGTSKSQLKPKKTRPLRLGLTGSLASGKSTTLKAFRKLGWKTLSADEVVAKIYREKRLTKESLRATYNTKAKIKKLEAWVHPMVEKRILQWMSRQRGPLIVEVPLLFEAKFDRFFDQNIFVYAPKADRLKRVLKRGMTLKLFRMLDKKQWSAKRKESLADFTLRNTTKKHLKKQIKKLSHSLLAR